MICPLLGTVLLSLVSIDRGPSHLALIDIETSRSFCTALNKISRDLFDLRRDSIRLQGVEEEVQQHLKMAESELRLITK